MIWTLNKFPTNFVCSSLIKSIRESNQSPTIVDIGAGKLPLVDIFLKAGFSYHAIDWDSSLIEVYEKKKVEEPQLFSYEIGDIRKLNLERKYSLVLCLNVLHFYNTEE
jgi:2-polyprenyl-3-methyl-5-hydroxy-6-metoxy-1,4-benzoquinol methylase